MKIVVSDVLVDPLHQFPHTAKRTSPDCVMGDQSKPALDLVEPARISRGVMNVIPPMARQPGSNPGVLVSCIIVGNQMDLELNRNVVVEVVKKREKFLIPMPYNGKEGRAGLWPHVYTA